MYYVLALLFALLCVQLNVLALNYVTVPGCDGFVCSKQGKDLETCLTQGKGNCRWISIFETRIQRWCLKRFGTLEECKQKCNGDFGCHGKPGKETADACTYTCKGLCRLDRGCRWTKNGCTEKANAGRRLDSEESKTKTLEQVVKARTLQDTCIKIDYISNADAAFNFACEANCASGCCKCTSCNQECAPLDECTDAGSTIDRVECAEVTDDCP